MRFALSVSMLLTTSALTLNLAVMSGWRNPARFILTAREAPSACRVTVGDTIIESCFDGELGIAG